ncbi:hypothetical protein CRYUN_Cryun11dG0072000 [Craigia yunnanensis]
MHDKLHDYFIYCTVYTNRDGNASSSTVNFDIAQPFASSELGGEVPYKKKKQTYQLETEMTRDKKEDAIPEKKMEPGNISEQDVEDENGSKSTRTICCRINCEYFIPPDNKGFEGHGMLEGMGLKDTVSETTEKPRRGRKRKEGDQSGDANWSIEMFMGNKASKRGRPSKRGEHTANGNNGMGNAQAVHTSCTIVELLIFQYGLQGDVPLHCEMFRVLKLNNL